MKQKIRITIAQTIDGSKSSSEFLSLLDKDNGMKYLEPWRALEDFQKSLKVAKSTNADFLIFPELFLPRQYLYRQVAKEAEESRIIILGGLEWNQTFERNGIKFITNNGFIAVPSVLDKQSPKPKEKSIIIPIQKLYASPYEPPFLERHGYEFGGGNRLYLFKSKELGNWAMLICYDYLNLPIQTLLQSKIQTLFIMAYNKDIKYYLSLSDSLHRILFCNIIVCNTGYYGGSHAFTPYRDANKRNVYQVIGNQIDATVTIELPLKSIIEEQIGERAIDEEPRFVQKAPDYGKMIFR